MSYNPYIHHRRSIRLKGYDYSLPGFYFFTICTHKRKFLFGEIISGKMILNDAGNAAMRCWKDIPLYYPFVILDEFVIMPDHIHGIIVIKNSVLSRERNIAEIVEGNADFSSANENDWWVNNFIRRGENSNSSVQGRVNLFHDKRPRGTSRSLGSIIRGYKIGVKKWFLENGESCPIWQRDYYEHIVRNELELNRIRAYIIYNPLNWRSRGDDYSVGANNHPPVPDN